MKRLTCEMCGGTDLVKDGGVFVCQTCGCKYSLEEAKKMMIEGTVEVAGTVKIDTTDNYNNFVQLARVAITDGRFDGAYNYCSEALVIVPNDPEMIAIQGLAVLGKEEIVTGVPLACVNAMNRMKAVMPDYKASFEQKREMLYSLKVAAAGVVKLKKALYDEQISNLNSQKVEYRASQEKTAAANLALQAFGGNVFTQQKAEADLEKAQAKRVHNEGLDAQISKISDKIKKMQSFATSFNEAVDDCLHNVDKEEKEFKKKRKAAYWEEHKEEKAELDARLASLNDQVKPILEIIANKKIEIGEIERERSPEEGPLHKKREQMQDEVRELSRKRANLGIFKGKEKKEITDEIARIQTQMPTIDDIQREKEERKNAKQPRVDALKAEVAEYAKQAAELNKQISEINTELNMER